MITETITPSLYNELVNQSDNPPGNDPVLGSYYQAIVIGIDQTTPIAGFLKGVQDKRPGLTDKHFVNLLYRTYQYRKLEAQDLSFRTFDTPEKWQPELARILADEESRKTWENLLLTKSTTTTIYQRYAGSYAVISHIFDGKPVSVADLGCGGNYALRGIELKEPFKPITDETPNQVLHKMLSQVINLERGLAIDKENPDDERVRKWRLACGFYPQELDELPSIVAFEDRIRKESRRVQFLPADLVSFNWLPSSVVDVSILSTVLYQLCKDEQVKLIEQAKGLLKPSGILIVQDFAAKNPEFPNTLTFNESWSGRKFGYRTFLACAETDWQFREALQWMGGRCTTVRAGEDFDEIFVRTPLHSKAYSRAFNAALAHSTS